MRGQISSFRKRLLSWFEQNQRPLPWRTQPNLYATVVSEFMLQQTQVDTVLPYFARWMQTFPDFHALARASETDVLKLWEGLGYYSRARNLHRLAKSVVAEGIPESPTDWMKRPGIGPYTAAAISSIAQNVPKAVVDGNVIRVLARIFNDDTSIKSSAEGMKRFQPRADAILDPQCPGTFNEAMMELGATICRKTKPACLLCPIREHCIASSHGSPEQLPVIVRKLTTRHTVHKLFVVRDNCLLLHIHPQSATRLAGLAELPTLSTAPTTGLLMTRTRGISSERITEHIFAAPQNLSKTAVAALVGGASSELHWTPLEEIDSISMSGPHRRWLMELLAPKTH